MRRLVFVATAAIVLLILCVIAVGWLLARPVPQTIGTAPPDLAATPVTFASASGATVHAWWCPVEPSSGTVILLPGVRANRLSMTRRARFLRGAGFSVLLPDLQGTGETHGSAITFGWRERHDVVAAVEFVRARAPASPIALLGSSLGGAAALFAAESLDVDAVVLEAVYPTIERATRNRLEMRFGTLGSWAAPLLLSQLRPQIGVRSAELRPVDYIDRLQCPVFLIGGAKDRHTTPADTMLLYRAARSPKQVWLVPDAAHVDLHRAATHEYEKRVSTFLRNAFRAPR